MEYNYIELGNFINSAKTGGDAIKKTPIVDYETDIRCLRIGDISNKRPYSKWGYSLVEEKYKNQYLLKKNDILIARTGNTIGVGTIIKNDINSVFNNGLIRLIINEKGNPYYIYYLITSTNFKNFIYSISGGTSTQPNIKIKHLLKYMVPDLPLSKQKQFANYLLNIDKKIDLNQHIIANLEELSKTLFKRWFVDFEFPDENGDPYKSSGGEMVDSELGKIPKGWECVYLKDIVHHKKDTFNPKKSNESEVKHFSLPAFDSGQYPTIDNVTDIKSNKWIIDENCILFSKMNPTTRRIWVTSYNENFLNVASSEFVVLKSDNSYRNAFIYNICISDKFNEYLVSNTTGSTNSRQRVKPDIAVQYRFAYNEEVSYLLSEKIEPYIEKIKIIREQNQNLTQLRDTLLPKLMSGEIEIPDDIEVMEDELSI